MFRTRFFLLGTAALGLAITASVASADSAVNAQGSSEVVLSVDTPPSGPMVAQGRRCPPFCALVSESGQGDAAAPVAQAAATPGGHITEDMQSVEVIHKGEKVVITRTEDPNATIPDAYLKVGRRCPPFCAQPMHVADGVETIGEMEVIADLQKIAGGDSSILVVDSRTPEWIARGTIPGSVNVPWTKISVDIASGFMTGDEMSGFTDVMTNQFGAVKTDGGWDFSNAKTLVLYCNGIWCPQSATNIKTLLRIGYPADKLKWYRGGMQDWVTLGLTTVNH